MNRHWKIGDSAGAVWQGKIHARGIISDFDPTGKYAMVLVSLGWGYGTLRPYPLDQLVPTGLTFWTPRHLKVTWAQATSPESSYSKRKK